MTCQKRCDPPILKRPKQSVEFCHIPTIWCAIPDVSIRGCRAIWCKFQGLAAAYTEDEKTRAFIRRLFCLPFLPADQIQPVFATTLNALTFLKHHSLCQLLDYISNTWVHRTIWPLVCWSVFNCSS